jgi:hypothetical protein
MDAPRPKTGGRQKGTPNKKTSARVEAMARVNEALNAMGQDAVSGMRLLQEVIRHEETPLDIKIQCSGLLLKHEAPAAVDTKYVVYAGTDAGRRAGHGGLVGFVRRRRRS